MTVSHSQVIVGISLIFPMAVVARVHCEEAGNWTWPPVLPAAATTATPFSMHSSSFCSRIHENFGVPRLMLTTSISR